LLYKNTSNEIKISSYLPSKPVAAADANIIKQLKDEGVLILPVAQGSNYLEVSFINDTIVDAKDLQLITQFKTQLVSLKLSNTNANDSVLVAISQCSNLIKLFINGTSISDKGLAAISKLDSLRYLNLTDTKITAQGVMQLKQMKNLQSLYLYHTSVTRNDWANLQQAFPKTKIDSGGYIVPTLATDTTEVKAKKEY
jgi:hypothetical protein